MSTKLSELAEKLDLTVKDLKVKINELGFEVSSRARVIDEEIAELVLEELSNDNSDSNSESEDVAEIYDEIIAQEQEREIIKSQRKKTAGRDDKKKSHGDREKDQKSSGSVEIGDTISVKEFSEKSGLTAAKIIGELMKNGVLANINQQIDFETVQVIGEDLGVKVKRIRKVGSSEDIMSGDITNLVKEDDSADLEERPPVVVIMGHVDHGKTKLLDTIRQADVVSGESGGITQHIGAYQVEKKGKKITFLDTPGHEAFTAMRARGAKVTDIAILVVAADEGVKPQTIEALNHAKEAEVPIIVAMNKMDKPNANPDMVKGQLTEHELQPEDWGGSTPVVNVSALTGDGIDDLLEMILLTAEIEELKANPNREAVGTVVEAHLDKNLGPVATILINTGTLKVMSNFIVGNTYGRVKLMKDHNGKAISKAGPSKPVFIAGLAETPKSGDILQMVKDERTAKMKSAEIKLIEAREAEQKMSGMNQLITQVQSDKVLKIVLKTDAKGSLEAIKQSLAKIKDEEVAVKIIHGAVGAISESDIMMAAASKGVVMAFHTKLHSPNVEKIAEREGVEVKSYSVIYDLIEEVKKILSGLLEPEVVEVTLGRAKVKQIFLTKKKEMVLGCGILSGKITKNSKLRVIRGVTNEDEDNVVGAGEILSLRKVDKEVDELKSGNDCGIRFKGDFKIEEGDILECYIEEEKIRTIE